MIEVEEPTEARATGDLAIGPVVVRRTDVPDELATDALVKPLGHVVLDEFLRSDGADVARGFLRTSRS
jgi:hypothetical protein